MKNTHISVIIAVILLRYHALILLFAGDFYYVREIPKMATINRKASSKPCVELLVLLDMTEDLCNALPINDLLPSLISHHVIDFKDKAEICVNKTEHHRVSYFLEKHLNNPLQLKPPHTAPFYQFLKVMQRSPKCGFLVERIQRRIEEYEAQASSEG